MYPELQQIYWYSGTYLQPQHLQSIDLHHSYMLSRHRQLSQPWCVGIIRCEFNPELLMDFTLKIEQLQAILPSGDYLEFPGNAMLQPRQFRESWKQLEKPFTLWLALRRFDPGHINVGDSPNSRWLKPHQEKTMKDVYFSGPECTVSRIIYNVQILSDEEKAAAVDCEFLPLVRLRYDSDRVIVDEEFCPPLVTVNGSPVLKKLLEGLYAQLANRAHQLEEYKRPDQIKNGSNTDMTLWLVMTSLNRTLPLLNHYCRAPVMHPWPVYGLLAQLAGELSVFSEQCSFNGVWRDDEIALLPYDHFNLCACFRSAKEVIIALMNNLMLEENTWITLQPDEQRIFYGDLRTLTQHHSGTVLLLLRSETMTADNTVSTSFKIAHDAIITTLIQRALPGVGATWLSQAPRGVPGRKNTFYFRLNLQDSLWKTIEQQQQIAFYWDDAPDDLQVELVFMGAE
ncbi:type VI secretion system baseplate subunit TssK [Enterobacter mori]|uniref:type VI secretion system baseplate subunit TssK n=1 Tax=Enterobacter mori TaxID=539813 RepID=UPI003B841D5A